MLDSLVRVSRRVGWVTDLLAASLRPPTGPPSRAAPTVRSPTPRECGGAAAFACDVLSRLPQGGGGGAHSGLVIPRSSDGPLADRLTTGDAHWARHRPPAVVRPSGRRACAARPAAASFERETNASGGTEARGRTAPVSGSPSSFSDPRDRNSRLNPPSTGFRGPTRLPLSSFTYS